jgi:hydroxypyruvate reductase
VGRAVDRLELPPSGKRRTRLVSAGKAAGAMGAAFARRWDGPSVEGLVSGPAPTRHALPSTIERFDGGHPLPNDTSAAAARRALDLASRSSPEDTLVVLLSGGSSAMLALPARGLTVDDKAAATQAMLRAGADIAALNTVRRHLSAIKGGQLAAACRGRVVTLAISDVAAPVEDDPSVIGSGPTVADPSTFGDALRAIERLGLRAGLPRPVVAHLERGATGDLPETAKPGDPALDRTEFHVIGNRRSAMEGARRAAESLGYRVVMLTAPVRGEARQAAVVFARAVEHAVAAIPAPACVLATGETTVRVIGGGRGGRNQEFVLALAFEARRFERPITVASVGTDGVDGPTDAAGGLIDSTTIERAAHMGVSAERALADNDSYGFLSALGDLVRTGPTGTNVGDLQLALVG